MSGTEKPRRFRAIDRLSRYATMADIERLDRLRMRRHPLDKGAPAAIAAPKPREMELIGCDEDGNMSVWSTCKVQPVSEFETIDNFYIKSGHFVIDWKGHAITVHCGNCASGLVTIQFMCSDGAVLRMHRLEVEPLLLGKVIRDSSLDARFIRALRRFAEDHAARNAAPDRRRGRISGRKRPDGED